MQLPTDEEIDAYARRHEISVEEAWRDYLLLRLAEGLSRREESRSVCVWEGAFVLRWKLESRRVSGDLDGTIGRKHDAVDPSRLRELMYRACRDDLSELSVPKAEFGPGARSLTFDPISFAAPNVGEVFGSIELSLREDLVLPALDLRIDSSLVPAFGILHIDLNEQVAEKMRCLCQRSKVADAYDVWFLWERRASFDRDLIRQRLVPAKLTSGKDHRADARKRLVYRRANWERSLGGEIPLHSPAAGEVFDACERAIEFWMD